LYRSGVISNFTIVSTFTKNKFIRTITFAVFFYKNSPFFRKIKTISSPSKKFFISYNSLKLAQKVFKNSILIISTSKGLLTNFEATKLLVGGLLVYIIT